VSDLSRSITSNAKSLHHCPTCWELAKEVEKLEAENDRMRPVYDRARETYSDCPRSVQRLIDAACNGLCETLGKR